MIKDFPEWLFRVNDDCEWKRTTSSAWDHCGTEGPHLTFVWRIALSGMFISYGRFHQVEISEAESRVNGFNGEMVVRQEGANLGSLLTPANPAMAHPIPFFLLKHSLFFLTPTSFVQKKSWHVPTCQGRQEFEGCVRNLKKKWAYTVLVTRVALPHSWCWPFSTDEHHVHIPWMMTEKKRRFWFTKKKIVWKQKSSGSRRFVKQCMKHRSAMWESKV